MQFRRCDPQLAQSTSNKARSSFADHSTSASAERKTDKHRKRNRFSRFRIRLFNACGTISLSTDLYSSHMHNCQLLMFHGSLYYLYNFLLREEVE